MCTYEGIPEHAPDQPPMQDHLPGVGLPLQGCHSEVDVLLLCNAVSGTLHGFHAQPGEGYVCLGAG
eukprot:11755257-Alexandrium_andersonii.AAC.1